MCRSQELLSCIEVRYSEKYLTMRTRVQNSLLLAGFNNQEFQITQEQANRISAAFQNEELVKCELLLRFAGL